MNYLSVSKHFHHRAHFSDLPPGVSAGVAVHSGNKVVVVLRPDAQIVEVNSLTSQVVHGIHAEVKGQQNNMSLLLIYRIYNCIFIVCVGDENLSRSVQQLEHYLLPAF